MKSEELIESLGRILDASKQRCTMQLKINDMRIHPTIKSFKDVPVGAIFETPSNKCLYIKTTETPSMFEQIINVLCLSDDDYMGWNYFRDDDQVVELSGDLYLYSTSEFFLIVSL